MGSDPPTTFTVHEHLICSSSEVFKSAMNGNWETSIKRSVNLGEEDPELFDLYLHWLYSQTLLAQNDSPGHAGNVEYLQLAKAYVLGDMIQDAKFKDAVLDAMLFKSRSLASDGKYWYPVGPVIRYIYDRTLESSKARRLLVDMYTYHGQGNWLTTWASEDDLPKQFLFDLAAAMLDIRPCLKQLVLTAGRCEYHEHAQDPSTCYTNPLVARRMDLAQPKPADSGHVKTEKPNFNYDGCLAVFVACCLLCGFLCLVVLFIALYIEVFNNNE